MFESFDDYDLDENLLRSTAAGKMDFPMWHVSLVCLEAKTSTGTNCNGSLRLEKRWTPGAD